MKKYFNNQKIKISQRGYQMNLKSIFIYNDNKIEINFKYQDKYNEAIIGLQQICHSNKKDIKNNNKRNTNYDKIELSKNNII